MDKRACTFVAHRHRKPPRQQTRQRQPHELQSQASAGTTGLTRLRVERVCANLEQRSPGKRARDAGPHRSEERLEDTNMMRQD